MSSYRVIKPGIASTAFNLLQPVRKARLLTIVLTISCSLPVLAHGPGHEEIRQITAQLAEQGDSAQLYAKRAHILQDNQHWLEAMSDLDKAAELDPENVDYDLDRAYLSYSAGEYQRSLDFVNLYILRHDSTAEAVLLKARCYRALNQNHEAAEFYELALSDASTLDGEVPLEWYVEFSDTLTATGDKQKALQVLEQGISQLGAISVFQVKAAELEVDLEIYDSALERIDQLLAQSQRKDIWLTRRADILASAGREKEAQQTYQQAYAALQQLPQRLQNLLVSRELATTLLARIESQ